MAAEQTPPPEAFKELREINENALMRDIFNLFEIPEDQIEEASAALRTKLTPRLKDMLNSCSRIWSDNFQHRQDAKKVQIAIQAGESLAKYEQVLHERDLKVEENQVLMDQVAQFKSSSGVKDKRIKELEVEVQKKKTTISSDLKESRQKLGESQALCNDLKKQNKNLQQEVKELTNKVNGLTFAASKAEVASGRAEAKTGTKVKEMHLAKQQVAETRAKNAELKYVQLKMNLDMDKMTKHVEMAERACAQAMDLVHEVKKRGQASQEHSEWFAFNLQWMSIKQEIEQLASTLRCEYEDCLNRIEGGGTLDDITLPDFPTLPPEPQVPKQSLPTLAALSGLPTPASTPIEPPPPGLGLSNGGVQRDRGYDSSVGMDMNGYSSSSQANGSPPAKWRWNGPAHDNPALDQNLTPLLREHIPEPPRPLLELRIKPSIESVTVPKSVSEPLLGDNATFEGWGRHARLPIKEAPAPLIQPGCSSKSPPVPLLQLPIVDQLVAFQSAAPAVSPPVPLFQPLPLLDLHKPVEAAVPLVHPTPLWVLPSQPVLQQPSTEPSAPFGQGTVSRPVPLFQPEPPMVEPRRPTETAVPLVQPTPPSQSQPQHFMRNEVPIVASVRQARFTAPRNIASPDLSGPPPGIQPQPVQTDQNVPPVRSMTANMAGMGIGASQLNAGGAPRPSIPNSFANTRMKLPTLAGQNLTGTMPRPSATHVPTMAPRLVPQAPQPRMPTPPDAQLKRKPVAVVPPAPTASGQADPKKYIELLTNALKIRHPNITESELKEGIREWVKALRRNDCSIRDVPVPEAIETCDGIIKAKRQTVSTSNLRSAMSPPPRQGQGHALRRSPSLPGSGNSSLSEMECVICYDPLKPDSQPTLDCRACGMLFHRECLGRWLRQGQRNCPHCRALCLDPVDYPSLG